MVPELEDLEQRGYFSRSEIKQVVQKRQDFEYNLKRRAALKEDYLRCRRGRRGGRANAKRAFVDGEEGVLFCSACIFPDMC